jgi:hypothetical protein
MVPPALSIEITGLSPTYVWNKYSLATNSGSIGSGPEERHLSSFNMTGASDH